MTPEQLVKVMPYSTGKVLLWTPAITAAMQEFGISTARRQAAFLAQAAHETGELRYLRELTDGTQYEGRADLGNTEPGDGFTYRGGGLPMLTGRDNYARCGAALNLLLVLNPSLLETAVPASRAGGWFFKTRGCNELADLDRFGEITKRWNGGYNGLDSRISYWLRARAVFNL